MFKIIEAADSYEADILSYLRLSDPSVKQDPRNKAIPVLEVLKLSKEREIAVTELWSDYWARVPVDTWAGFADFIRQILEVRHMRLVFNSTWWLSSHQGLAYLHEHRIAHLDISDGNIVTGPLSFRVYPKPPRSFAFIDFELSVIYPLSDPGPFKTTGNVATHVAPEMSPTIGYDPFKVDIWQMGTLLTRAAKVGLNMYDT
jgi:serine/threonine protein kinase